MGYPEERTSQALIAVGADATEETAVRLAAFGRARSGERWFDAALTVLESQTDGDETMDSELIVQLGKRMTFRQTPEMRQRWQAAMRRLLDDPRASVRLQAYRTLVANHDTLAVSRISDSLRDRQNVPVPVPEAVAMLDLDGPMNHVEVLRLYLEDPDLAVRAQAALALGIDDNSRATLVRYATDERTPVEVRVHALRGLARVGRSFPDVAIPLVENQRTNSRVRQEAMKSMVGVLNYNQIDAKTKIRFFDVLSTLAVDPQLLNVNDGLGSEAKEVQAYLIRAFPEVKRHHENR
jgi:hypothetical protein